MQEVPVAALVTQPRAQAPPDDEQQRQPDGEGDEDEAPRQVELDDLGRAGPHQEQKLDVGPALEQAIDHPVEFVIGIGQAGEVGTLKPGAWADLIAVDGDPLADVTVLEDVDTVLKGVYPEADRTPE